MTPSGARAKPSARPQGVPHHTVGMSAREQFFAEQGARRVGQVRVERRRFDDATAQGIRHDHGAAANRLDQTGNAERRIGAQLERIGEIRVEAAKNYRHPLESAQRAQIHDAVAHREIFAFDQLEPEVAREIGVFEVGFVVRTGRQQHRMAGGAARQTDDRVAIVAEKRRQPLHAQFAEQLGKGLANDDAVLERVAETAGRVGPARVHGPRTIRFARDIGRVQVHVHPVRRRHALQRTQILRMTEHEVRGHDAFAQQPGRDRRCRARSRRRGARAG